MTTPASLPPTPRAPQTPSTRRSPGAWLLGLLALMVALIGTGGWLHFNSQQSEARRLAAETLDYIATLKADQITQWMQERRAYAEARRDQSLARRFLQAPHDPALRQELHRREGSEVVFLNDLRHRADSALALRLPLDPNQHLPAAMAAQGQEGVVEGVDYRGVPVLAVTRKIAGTPWFMVAKEDEDELHAPLRRQTWTTGLLGALLVLLATLGVSLAWHQQKLVSSRLVAAVLRESAAGIRAITDSAQEAIIKMDAHGTITFWNPAAERILGYMPAEALGQNLHALLAPERFHAPFSAAFPVDGYGFGCLARSPPAYEKCPMAREDPGVW